MKSNQYDYLASYSVEELQGYYSDFHKDFYGFRPRGASADDFNNRAWLEFQIDSIHEAMDRLKATAQGRKELRANGWVIEETI